MRNWTKFLAASLAACFFLLFDIYQKGLTLSEGRAAPVEHWSPYRLPNLSSAQILSYIKDTPALYGTADIQTQVPNNNDSRRDPINPAWAYFDPRYQRVTVMVMSLKARGTTVFCHYVAQNGTALHFRSKSLVDPEYIVHCKQKTFSEWIYLSESDDIESDDLFNQTGPVQVTLLPHEPAPSGSLVMCLAPIFGDYHYWLLLLQFIEYHHIVGAHHYFVYVHSIHDSATQAVLDFYERRNLIDVIYIHKSENNTNKCVDIHRCRHNVQINDCVYRSINRFQYAAVVDIDELLQPFEHETLQEMIRSVDKPIYGAFKFRCRWMFRGKREPSSSRLWSTKDTDVNSFVSRYLPSLRWHNSTQPAPVGHTAKCIVKPDKITFQGVHFVRSFVEENSITTYNVPVELGQVRHYRNTSAQSWQPIFMQEAINFGTLTNTSLNVAQEQRLLLRVACVMSRIRGDQQPYDQYCVF